jgi:hypothetical protein
MRNRVLAVMGLTAVVAGVSLMLTTVAGQTPTKAVASTNAAAAAQTTAAAKAAPAPKTAWGDPDLQGIWDQVFNTPLQRPAKYANREFFTDQERAEIDRQRAALLRRDKRAETGTEKDVAGAYNSVFTSPRYAGRRTSLIVDPPDGRIPPVTAAAAQRATLEREYRLALLQATSTCKNKDRGNACANWEYGPPSPQWDSVTPFYNTGRLNRHAGPEDGSLGDRCMSAVNPDFAGYKRIVQTPGGVTMFYDTGQGQGWQRNIVMNGTPHLPASIQQWWGDSRGHWEGNTLVVDVSNFSPKSNFMGAHQNLHLVERWTRTDADTLEYAVKIEDPTVWTKPWTVKVELTRQDDHANRFYTEPRCFEGNYGLPGLLLGERLVEAAYAEGRGPHPASLDNSTCETGDAGEDPLAGGGN